MSSHAHRAADRLLQTDSQIRPAPSLSGFQGASSSGLVTPQGWEEGTGFGSLAQTQHSAPDRVIVVLRVVTEEPARSCGFSSSSEERHRI